MSSVPVKLKEADPVRLVWPTVSVKSVTASKSSDEAIPLPTEPSTDTVTGIFSSKVAVPVKAPVTVTSGSAPSAEDSGFTLRLTSGKESLSWSMPMKSLRTVHPEEEPDTSINSGRTSATASSNSCSRKLPVPVSSPEEMVTSNGVTAAKSVVSAQAVPPAPIRETLTGRAVERGLAPVGRETATLAVTVVPSAAVFCAPFSSESKSTRR